MVTFLFASHEITLLVLTYTFLRLAKREAVRERFDVGPDAVLAGEAPESGDPQALTYTEYVI